MENRYRTNLKKVYLSDQELIILNKKLAQSQCPNFSYYARKTLLDPGMNFITIDTRGFQDLIFEIRRIGNNINQIAKRLNVESKGGAIKETTYIKAMNALISIRDSLLSVIK